MWQARFVLSLDQREQRTDYLRMNNVTPGTGNSKMLCSAAALHIVYREDRPARPEELAFSGSQGIAPSSVGEITAAIATADIRANAFTQLLWQRAVTCLQVPQEPEPPFRIMTGFLKGQHKSGFVRGRTDRHPPLATSMSQPAPALLSQLLVSWEIVTAGA